MTYVDHANRHGYGGTDPALFGWESTGSGGGGGGADSVQWAWMYRGGSKPNIVVPSASVSSTSTHVDNFEALGTDSVGGITADLTNGKLTVPVAGIYDVTANATFPPSGAYYPAAIGILRNSLSGTIASFATSLVPTADYLYLTVSWSFRLAAGDYVTMAVGQNSGTNKNVVLTTMVVYLVQGIA